jgi:hypothetical protein
LRRLITGQENSLMDCRATLSMARDHDELQ